MKNSRLSVALLAFTVLATAITDSAFAQLVVDPVSGTASTDYNATTTAANVTTIADLNGLNEHTGDATFRNWLNSAAGSFVNENWLFVDLGAAYDLEEVRIWNYHEVAGIETNFRGLDDFKLYLGSPGAVLPTAGSLSGAGDTIPYDKFSSLAGWTHVLDGNLDIGPSSLLGPNDYPLDPLNTFAVANTDVQFIGIDVGAFNQGGFGGSATNGGFNSLLGLAQIQAVATVPEPASVAMWLFLGLVSLGYGWKRRRQGA